MERETNIDWLIGLVGALASLAAVAALSFNFFQTEPIHSLRISAARDIYTVVLLLLVGVVVGELAHRAQSALDAYRSGHSEVAILHATALQCRTATSANAAILPAVTAVGRLMTAEAVTFERADDLTDHTTADPATQRVINRDGTTGGIPYRVLPEGYDLGPETVWVEVAGTAGVHGHIVVPPTAGAGVGLDRRLGAITIASQLAMAPYRLDRPGVATPRSSVVTG